MDDFEFDGALDLTGADTSVGNFEAAPSGTYQCHIENVVWKKVENEGGKLPVGTPYLTIWWKCDEEDERNGVRVKNKVFFQSLYPIAPEGYDADKAAKNKGSVVNMLTSIGFTSEQINKKGFRLDPEVLMGKEASVVVRRYKNEYKNGEFDNNVQGVKPLGASSSSSAGALV